MRLNTPECIKSLQHSTSASCALVHAIFALGSCVMYQATCARHTSTNLEELAVHFGQACQLSHHSVDIDLLRTTAAAELRVDVGEHLHLKQRRKNHLLWGWSGRFFSKLCLACSDSMYLHVRVITKIFACFYGRVSGEKR